MRTKNLMTYCQENNTCSYGLRNEKDEREFKSRNCKEESSTRDVSIFAK